MGVKYEMNDKLKHWVDYQRQQAQFISNKLSNYEDEEFESYKKVFSKIVNESNSAKYLFTLYPSDKDILINQKPSEKILSDSIYPLINNFCKENAIYIKRIYIRNITKEGPNIEEIDIPESYGFEMYLKNISLKSQVRDLRKQLKTTDLTNFECVIS